MYRFLKSLLVALFCSWFGLSPFVTFAQDLSHTSSTGKFEVGFRPEAILEDRDIFEIGNMTLASLQRFLSSKGTLGTYRTNDIDGIEKPASEIIWRVAGSYRINPRYLLALMQKEQSLVDDPHPTKKQFDWATGYGICDACSKDDPSLQEFKGFASQLEWAAKQHREKYLIQILGRGKTIAGYSPGKLAMIDHVPIVPVNNATAMLYSYTPHIHGNLNLWRIWQRWFSTPFPDGTTVKAEDSGKIYVIRFGEKRPYANLRVALSMVDAGKMVVTQERHLFNYPNGEAIRFPNYALIETPDHERYLLVGEKKRRFASSQVFRTLGFNTDEIVEATEDDLTAYEDGPDITKTTRYAVGILAKDQRQNLWYIEDGARHTIPHASLVHLYFRGWPVKRLTAKEISAFRVGEPYQLHDGELVRLKGDAAVYVMEHGERRPIPSAEAFEGFGWNWKNVVTLPKVVMDDYPLGEPLSSYTSPSPPVSLTLR